MVEEDEEKWIGRGGGCLDKHNYYQNQFGEKGESYNSKSIQCYYYKKFSHIEKYCVLKEKHVKFVDEKGKDNEESKTLFLACYFSKECI